MNETHCKIGEPSPVRGRVACGHAEPGPLRGSARLAFVLLLFIQPAARAQKATPDLSDDPEIARALMQLPSGFEAQLVASEPTIINPLAMNFDPNGRLWVLCAASYPQLLPGQQPKDYVVVLEDFHANGKPAKSHVFVDGLTVPTGIMPGDGGVYIGQGESLLHFRDTKGAGKADERRVLFTGFGTADTHHTLNTFRWGPDGGLYFNQGLYIKSTVETPTGPRQIFGGAAWRLRTDRMSLEVYDRSIQPNNTWGHAFDRWGQSFFASAWPGALNLCLPDSPLHQGVRTDIVPSLKMTQIGGERHCGLEIVTGSNFPDDWQGNLLTGDFLSHRIYRYSVADDGKRFQAKLLAPLVQSKHRKFRPIDIKMGPDGAVYISDLHQQIIQHNQVDFRDPRRDHSRGRIWRIVYKDRPLTPNPKLADLATAKVVERLKDSDPWVRQQAKRVLAERPPSEASAALQTWLKALPAGDANLSRHGLETLWAFQNIDQVEPALLNRMLRTDDPNIRTAATRVLGFWHDRLPDIDRLIATQAADEHPRVRLEAVMAAGWVPKAGALQAALVALDHPTDPLLDFALRRTTVLLQPYWYPEFQAGKFTLGGKAKHLVYALQAIRAPDATLALTQMWRAGKVAPEYQADVLQMLASLGDLPQQTLVWNEIRNSKTLGGSDRARLLDTFEQAARAKKTKPLGESKDWQQLFADTNLRSGALRLAGAWKVESLRNDIAGFVEGDARAAAIDALVDLGGPATLQSLYTWAKEPTPFATRQQAIVGLARLDQKKAALLAGLLLRQTPPAGQSFDPLFTAFARLKGGLSTLASELKGQPPAVDAAKVGLRVLAELGVSDAELVEVLQKAVGERTARRQLDAAEMKRLLTLAQTQGDPHRGEAVFRRGALGCFSCHAIGGAGSKVGPDLSGIGASAQPDYLLESILAPAKIIREGYNTARVFTSDGKAYSGIVLRDTPTELVLRDPLRDEIAIPAGDIEAKKIGGSLMPDGLDATLTDADLADLVRFLTELGRPGPFQVSHVPVARTWQIGVGSVPTWANRLSQVSGDVPLADVKGSVTAKCHIEVFKAGRVALAFKAPAGSRVSVAGKEMSGDKVAVDLPAGFHEVVVRIEAPAAALRCEIADGPARFVVRP